MDLNKLIDTINNESNKDSEYFLFEYLLKNDISKEEEKYILSHLDFKKKMFFVFAKKYFDGLDCKKSYEVVTYRDLSIDVLYDDFFTSYNRFLKKINKLGQELGCNNSLDYSVLFYVLLVSGRFSINGKHEYDTKNKLNIDGHYYLDIFQGHGVCINYSDMLRDLLNVSGYQSLNMLCYSDDYNSFASRANHSVNLIVEDNSPYLFDSTNFAIYGCRDNKHASLIDGVASHNLILYPYLSGIFFSHKADTLGILKDFCLRKDYDCSYTSKDLTVAVKKCDNYVHSNHSLISDFRSDIMSDILDIAYKTKVKKSVFKCE